MSAVTTTAPVSGGFDSAAALRGLAGFGAVGLGLSALGLATGISPPCPWRMLTGTLCPLCGATHVGMALLQGDLVGAWAANPFVLIGLLVLTLLGSFWTLETLGGAAVRPPRWLRLSANRWWLVVGVGAVAFALWRNLA